LALIDESGLINSKKEEPPPSPYKVVVEVEDTLIGIAYRHYPKKMKEGVDAILEANPDITKRGMIYPGQELIVPGIDSRHSSLPEPIAEGKTYFTVQVCTLLKLGKDVAETFTNELRQKGYPAYFTETKTKNGKHIYKIRIGRYKTRAEAREMALSFQNREKKLFLIFKSEIDISQKFLQDESASDPSAEERNTGLPEYSDDEEQLHVDNMTQKKQEKITDKDIKGKAVANNQIIEFKLRDDVHYSVYGNYSSMEELQKAMAQLKQNKVKFLVEISNDHDGTTTHRIILGGYEKVEELNKAIESLKVKTE
jgi:phage tail protein X